MQYLNFYKLLCLTLGHNYKNEVNAICGTINNDTQECSNTGAIITKMCKRCGKFEVGEWYKHALVKPHSCDKNGHLYDNWNVGRGEKNYVKGRTTVKVACTYQYKICKICNFRYMEELAPL